MRTVLAMAVLACLGTAEAAQAQDPSPDLDSVYQTSVRDRLAGRTDEAISGSRRVLAGRPDDVDARLNLGLALIAAGRPAEARVELEGVLARAPNYADARDALSQINRLSADVAEWRADVSVAYSHLSEDLDPWREISVSLSRQFTRDAVSATIEHAERFGLSDTYAEARLDRRWGVGAVYGAFGGTPGAEFRPEVAVRAGGQMPLGDQGWSVTADAAIARYAVGTVSTVQPGLEFVTADGRLTLGGRWINVWDEQDTYRSGYSLRAALEIVPKLRLRVGYADAPESSDGATVDVQSTSLGLEIDVTERVVLRLNGANEDRVAYDRQETILSVGLRF